MIIKDVTKRFIEVYNYLKREGFVKNPADFARKIKAGRSTVNEIISGRSNVGLEIVQCTVQNFAQISLEWLMLGIGHMLKAANSEPLENPVNLEYLKKLSDKNEEIIKFLRADNHKLSEEVAKLRELYLKNDQLEHDVLKAKEELLKLQQDLLNSREMEADYRRVKNEIRELKAREKNLKKELRDVNADYKKLRAELLKLQESGQHQHSGQFG